MRHHLLISLLALGVAGVANAAEHDHGDEHGHEEGHLESVREGHADVLVLYEEAEGLHLAIAAGEHDHDHEGEGMTEGDEHGHEGEEHDHEHLELDHVEIVAGAKAMQITPEGENWSFLGEANRYVYILPQAEIEGLPFLGINTEELDATLFSSDLTLTLVEVEGPGAFTLYQVDAFGQPVLLMDSTSDPADSIALPEDTHFHMNWAFSAPGEYILEFTIAGTLADSTEIVSEVQAVRFHIVGGPTYIHEGETEVALSYEADHGLEFSLLVDEEHDHEEGEGHGDEVEGGDHDDEHEHGEGMHPADAIVVLGGYSVKAVPEGDTLAFLGAPGTPFYLIGQSEEEGVPFLGWAAEDLDPAAFSGDPVIELHEVEGPGDLFLYEVDSFGNVTIIWNTADAEEDVLVMAAGSHSHYNLAVTEPGIYELELHAEAVLADLTEVDTHTEITLQAGGLEGYIGHFERPFPDWMVAETGGILYSPNWPWLWSDSQGWLFAVGHGGPNHLYYHESAGEWIWTSHEVFPYYWSFNSVDWILW